MEDIEDARDDLHLRILFYHRERDLLQTVLIRDTLQMIK